MNEAPTLDFLDVTAMPLPMEFEEQISADNVTGVEFFTEDFWQNEESIVMTGGRVYAQHAARVELIENMETFTFHAIVTNHIDAEGEEDSEGEFIRIEQHNFVAECTDNNIITIIYNGFDVIDETYEDDD